MITFPPLGEDLRDEAGNPIVTWDLVNNLRIEHAPDGTTTSRDLESDELIQLPDILAARATREQRETDRAVIRAIVTDVKLEQDRAQTVLDDPNATSREKALARATKRMGGAIIDLAKFVKDQ